MQTTYVCIGRAFAWVYPIVLLLCLFVIPFAYALKTGRTNKGILLAWGLWFAVMAVNAAFLPAIAKLHELTYGQAADADVGLAMGAAIAAALFGWIPGTIICGAAVLLRSLGQRIRNALDTK